MTEDVLYQRRRRFWQIALPALLILVAVVIAVTDARKENIRADFSKYSLAASRVMFSGDNPYDKQQVDHNYKYFPTNAILLFPFTKIPVYAAQGIWFSINLGLLIWAFISLREMLRPSRVPWWVFGVALAIMFRIIVMNLRLGQWNTSVFCLSIIGLRYLHEGRRWGSVLLALSITLKFMPAIFLLYLAARRRWKDLALTCAAAIFWIAIFPVLTLGPERTIKLMRFYQAESVERVESMTEGKEVSSVSLHSTIYRAMSPVSLELKDIYYTANLLNLPREQGAMVAKIFSAILLAVAVVWLIRQGRKEAQINELGTLLLIGLCYMTWFLAAPGVRHAQLISTIPMTFAIAAAAAFSPDRKSRLIIGWGLVAVFILYTIPSEIVEGTTYNAFLEASGVIAWAMMAETALGVYAFYSVGLGSFVSRSWQVSSDMTSLLGDPRY